MKRDAVSRGIKFLACVALLANQAQAGAALDSNRADDYQAGTKYSSLQQINRANVGELELAWEYHTGDLAPEGFQGLVAFEDHPRLVDGKLIVCSIERRVIALDPASGEELWTFDPGRSASMTKKCRGVGHWVDRDAPAGTQCRSRLFLGTDDYRLLAIDAATGRACEDFGEDGVVAMPTDRPLLWTGEVAAGSDPAVVGNVVVVASAVVDSQRVAAPSGRVLAFDARSGAPLWQFDPVPRDPNDPAMTSWGKGTEGFGQGNVWSSMAVDNKLGLVYLPTTSTSDDFYGGNRPGDNHYTTSVVALRGATGEVAWHYQLVHHNVFDYDIPTRPMLIDYPVNGRLVPALLQNTKQGLVFIFDRASGEPLVPIAEQPVPQTGAVPGEQLSPTQPIPQGMPTLAPQGFSPDDVWGFTPLDRHLCRKKVEEHLWGPAYMPASLQGTVISPAFGGGPNWGGGAYDPHSHVMVVPSNRVPNIIRLIPRDELQLEGGFKVEASGKMVFENKGSPYAPEIQPLLSIFGAPCSEPPWAALTALDIVQKKILWEVPLGSIKELSPIPLDWNLGAPGAGGPLLTAGGLVFIGYATDNTLRAFDAASGEVLWQAPLPAPANSVPVTYEVDGEQYLVVPAGGHSVYGKTTGDSVRAYRLPRAAAH
ncbi:pyrroloquinoline quinone-dependent dehydrogenase [Mangrovimicrobium sediminis]|uniref:Pyrroloquinoline quinone-dependent dehydrogenase n=1 Tax=Mangrovimicrobium sediminis TaxID=2562682 RepID=A0A4Z0LWL6_9GAMM|nr:pyrroloquinoline quinone-dependent dehydrogenase [Haliea sp. SAOS-164]TGD71803.1 pyrroloquinoline quinone-dependent dehydrogenase [Haliea sp. SAOS-164]